jgi:hypothetical protein
VHDNAKQEPNPVRLVLRQEADGTVTVSAVSPAGNIISDVAAISEFGIYICGYVDPSLGLPLDTAHNNCVVTRLSTPEGK